jgi:quinol monooxygenase YgiN
MNTLQLSVICNIHDGKLNEFKELAGQCMAVVREKEPNAQQYDWYFNADESQCVIRETYADSETLLTHLGNVGEPLGKLPEEAVLGGLFTDAEHVADGPQA